MSSIRKRIEALQIMEKDSLFHFLIEFEIHVLLIAPNGDFIDDAKKPTEDMYRYDEGCFRSVRN